MSNYYDDWVSQKNSNAGPPLTALILEQQSTKVSSITGGDPHTDPPIDPVIDQSGGSDPPTDLFSPWGEDMISARIGSPIHLTQVSTKYPVFLLHGVLSTEECRELCKAVPSDGLGFMSLEDVATMYRGRRSTRYLSFDQTLSTVINQRISQFFPQILNGGTYTGLAPEWRYLKYEEGGYFSPHIDGREGRNSKDGYIQSRLTVQCYINNCGVDKDYQGGELVFYDRIGEEKFILEPKEGDVIVFYQEINSSDMYHGGNNVTAGCKFAMRTMAEYMWESKAIMEAGESTL